MLAKVPRLLQRAMLIVAIDDLQAALHEDPASRRNEKMQQVLPRLHAAAAAAGVQRETAHIDEET